MFLNVGANTRRKQISIKEKFKLPAGTGGETEAKFFFYENEKIYSLLVSFLTMLSFFSCTLVIDEIEILLLSLQLNYP